MSFCGIWANLTNPPRKSRQKKKDMQIFWQNLI